MRIRTNPTTLLAAVLAGQARLERFTQRKLHDRSAFLISTIAHWAYESASGAGLRRPGRIAARAVSQMGAMPFGAAVFAGPG
jgi:hypothetical protein